MRKRRRRDGDDREMELTEHLAELRARIARSLLYAVAGTAVAWLYYEPILAFVQAPIKGIRDVPWQGVFTDFLAPFFMRLQVSVAAGLILVFPFLLGEAWGFVRPALTRRERRAVYLVGPLCILLFVGGVASGYFIMPAGIRFFLSFLPKDAQLMQKLNDYVLFMVKTCLAFGAAYQLPIVLLFLGKVGLVNSRFLIKHWRQAIVLCAGAAALITPSADAFTMVAMAAPLALLYGLSIILVRLVERSADREETEPDEE